MDKALHKLIGNLLVCFVPAKAFFLSKFFVLSFVLDKSLFEPHVPAIVYPKLFELLDVLSQFPDNVRMLVYSLEFLGLFLKLEALLNGEFAGGSVEQLHFIEFDGKSNLGFCQLNEDVKLVLGQNC